MPVAELVAQSVVDALDGRGEAGVADAITAPGDKRSVYRRTPCPVCGVLVACRFKPSTNKTYTDKMERHVRRAHGVGYMTVTSGRGT